MLFDLFNKFEWDKTKNNINRVKHGLDFNYAKNVFYDDYRIEFIDTRKEYGEKRLQTIGDTGQHILFVVYTKRGRKYRLISARIANKKEKEFYYD
ncbi:toxin BrnT [Candidatus Termititenax aidoneus]|uniref:Toxin BrnT n=1 Tax=Termititenax aidoneus TaxID=2218524 RepID=A0A388TBG5_TERA1|nr:toxin BrnT [Candidatus Termititenax aidoneus]